MPISIIGLRGPHEGQTFEFDATQSEILFGRSNTSDIQFPAEDTLISRHHLTLSLRNDRYFLSMQNDNPVLIDGKEAFPDDELSWGEHVLTVGDDKDDPSYRVSVTSQDDNLAPTQAVYKTQKTSRQFSSSKIKILSVFTVIGLAVAGIAYTLMNQQQAALQDRFAQFNDKFQVIEKQSNFANIVKDKRKSVYLVAIKRGDDVIGQGTAWVVGPGLLATNAHVVEGLEEALKESPDLQAVVVSSVSPTHYQHTVLEMKKHPHYNAFWEHQSAIVRVMENNQKLDLVPGYDVGLLKVDNPDLLSEPLTIAGQQQLTKLDSGERISFVGYPLEDAVGGGTSFSTPTPQMQFGTITSLTDYFLVKEAPARNHLIQHNLPGHGGASGSPIFNQNGEVIALYSAGNIVFVNGHRIATGIGVNFGQRADVLSELINDQVEGTAQQRMEFWGERLARYKTPMEVIHLEWLDTIESIHHPDIELVHEHTGALTFDESIETYRYKIALPNTKSALEMLIVAQSTNGKDVDLAITDKDLNIIARDKEPEPYANITLEPEYDLDSNKEYFLYVLGEDETVTFDLKIYSLK